MDTDDVIRSVITLVVGGGGVGWLSTFLSRRGQREENTNAAAAAAAAARLGEAVEDRAQLTAEREENTRLREMLREEQDRTRQARADGEAREATLRAEHTAHLREQQEQWTAERVTLQETFKVAFRELADDLATLKAVTVQQVKHVADGGSPVDVPTPDMIDELGV